MSQEIFQMYTCFLSLCFCYLEGVLYLSPNTSFNFVVTFLAVNSFYFFKYLLSLFHLEVSIISAMNNTLLTFLSQRTFNDQPFNFSLFFGSFTTFIKYRETSLSWLHFIRYYLGAVVIQFNLLSLYTMKNYCNSIDL